MSVLTFFIELLCNLLQNLGVTWLRWHRAAAPGELRLLPPSAQPELAAKSLAEQLPLLASGDFLCARQVLLAIFIAAYAAEPASCRCPQQSSLLERELPAQPDQEKQRV